MAENATLFVAYNQTQQWLARHFPYDQTNSQVSSTPITHLAISGAVAGAAASFVLTPVELVKCRMQVQMVSPAYSTPIIDSQGVSRLPKPPGPISIARQAMLTKGVGGLWLGQTGTFLREAGGSCTWFLAFELVSRYFIKRRGPTATRADLSAAELMLAGASAGTSYTVTLFPADTIKSTIQTADEYAGGERKGFIATGREMVRNRGWRALYNGCGVTVLRSAPSSAIIFSIYAWLEQKFG